jgi:hypothetical protein
VNGANDLRLYNGTAWQTINSASTPAFTNVDTDDLTYVWAHKRRLWFCEKGEPSVWYLPVDSIAGAAVEFPLRSVFTLGGAVLFGATWSRDAGDGMDDLQVFVSTEGQVAIYQGTDPNNASTWALVGLYRIGRPLHKNAHFRTGGDIMVLTEDGIVAISSAMERDRTAQQSSAATAMISDLWAEVVAIRQGLSRFPCVLWPSRRFLLVGAPAVGSQPLCLASNATTGAWSRILGWDTQALAVFNDSLIFGDSAGRVCKGDSGGSDLGLPYEAVCVPKMQDMSAPERKFLLRARATFRAGSVFNVALFGAADFVPMRPDEAAPANTGGDTAQLWGGSSVWGSGVKWGAAATEMVQTNWQTVLGAGQSVAPGLMLSVARSAPRVSVPISQAPCGPWTA